MNNMNVLEKILEEIEDRKQKYKDELILQVSQRNINEICGKVAELEEIEKIIRSYMGTGKDTNVPSNWIACSERLPEEGKEVLAQFVVRVRHTNGQVDEMVYIYPLHYEEGEWKSFHGMPNGKVEAWQPLPEPYKGEEAVG